jgi:hypothetical protein
LQDATLPSVIGESMEARRFSVAIIATSVLCLGASYRTQNFVVTAPTPQFAQQLAITAENFRRDLAVEWLGHEIPPWSEPCPIRAEVGQQLGAGGATSFAFVGGQPTGWTMSIQGSAQRILDSVLPHEITHTIFATHYGRPLPRWADEGACTIVEHESEKQKQHRLLYEFLTTGRGIAFNHMFAMQDYPSDMLPLYSQGYSLARFLVAQGGKQKFVEYVGDGMRWNNWTKATEKHYQFHSLSDLQVTWLDWVRRGCPDITSSGTQLAKNDQPQSGQLASAGGQAVAREELVSFASTATPAPVKGTATGWYARVRDETVASRNTTATRATNPLHTTVGQVLSRTKDSSTQIVTRPQPTQQAQQQVIEWEKK